LTMLTSALKLGRSPRNTPPTVVDDPRMFAMIANSIKRLLDDEQKRFERGNRGVVALTVSLSEQILLFETGKLGLHGNSG
jgi:hypothetical protein